MGIFAETTIEITCDTVFTARKVAKAIKGKHKEDVKDYNYVFSDLVINGNEVCLDKDSGRIQNLEYQCNVLWDLIKDIKGVKEMNCPFMVEGDGLYFEN